MPTEPPPTGGYMVAAYIVAAVIYLGYTISLWKRSAAVRRSRHRGNP